MTRKPSGSLLTSGLDSDVDVKRWMERYRPRAETNPSEQCLGPSWPPTPAPGLIYIKLIQEKQAQQL